MVLLICDPYNPSDQLPKKDVPMWAIESLTVMKINSYSLIKFETCATEGNSCLQL